MSRPKNKYDRQHLQHLQQLQRQIDAIYQEATREAALIGAGVDNFDKERPFSFDDYPLTRMRIEDLMFRLKASIEVCVVNGVNSEWTLANNKNNELANRVFGKNVGRLTQEQYRRYYSNNDAARDAFLKRKERGLDLSDRVWRYTGEFKDEIEMGIDLGLRGGLSADQMTRELRQFLQHPDMLFRRVRDEHGMLHLSKRASAFHPGRGVYRSSYMNARRLAATEGNIAYRTSDHERWQQMDFVVGIEIHLSNNHTCKGRDGKPHPFHDICDELAGRYPKDFKFTGWHPHCRCFATSILKTDEEIARDTQKILKGEPVGDDSVNKVNDVPDAFKQWVSDNSDRIENARSIPYFLKDNDGYFRSALSQSAEFAPAQPASLDDVRRLFNVKIWDDDIFDGSTAKQFEYEKVYKKITNALQAHGLKIDYCETSIFKKDFYVSFESKDVKIQRSFVMQSDGLEVHHDLFVIPKSAQGKGLSKEVFGIFYEQYKKLGVRKINVHANIDVGGYTWARYGFKANSKRMVMNVIKDYENSRENKQIANEARTLVEKWYKDNNYPDYTPFPMRLLTEQPWGKDLLLGSDWGGEIDLWDTENRLIFESYLGL